MLAAMRLASSRGEPALPFASNCAMMRSRGQSSLRLIGCVFNWTTSPGRSWQPGNFHCSKSGNFAIFTAIRRLVAGEQVGRRAPSRLVLEMDVGERLPLASRTMKQASESHKASDADDRRHLGRHYGRELGVNRETWLRGHRPLELFPGSAIGQTGGTRKLSAASRATHCLKKNNRRVPGFPGHPVQAF
jgi:hypothetical protein